MTYLLSLFRENKKFLRYWVSNAFAHASGTMVNIIFAYLSIMRGGAVEYSLVMGFSILFQTFSPFPAGFLADRINRGNFLFLTRTLQSLLILGIGLSHTSYVSDICYVTFTIISSMNGPFTAGLVQSILKKDQIVRGTSLNSLAISVFSMIGGIFGVLESDLGLLLFIFITASFRVLSGGLLYGINPAVKGKRRNEVNFKTRSIGLTSLGIATVLGISSSFPVALNLLAEQELRGSLSLSLISIASSGGHLIGSLVMGNYRGNTSKLLKPGVSLHSTLIAIFALIPPWEVLPPLSFLRGFFATVQNVSWRSSLRTNLPNEIMGRVWGSITTASSIISSAILFILGVSLPVIGLTPFFIGLGVLGLLSGIFALFEGLSRLEEEYGERGVSKADQQVS